MKVIYAISRFAGYISTTMVGLLTFFTVTDVFLRYAFNSPIMGTPELSEFMMVIVVFPALAWCALVRKHVRVDLLVTYLPRRAQLAIDGFTLLLTIVVFAFITWRSFLESGEVSSQTSLLNLPHAPFYWVLTAGMGLFTISVLTIFIEHVTEAVKHER